MQGLMVRGVKLEHNGHDWKRNNFLYATDAVLRENLAEGPQRLVNDFWRRKLKVT